MSTGPAEPRRNGGDRDRDGDDAVGRQEQRLRAVERELVGIRRRLDRILALVRGDEIAPFRPWDGDGRESRS